MIIWHIVTVKCYCMIGGKTCITSLLCLEGDFEGCFDMFDCLVTSGEVAFHFDCG